MRCPAKLPAWLEVAALTDGFLDLRPGSDCGRWSEAQILN
jgi:hypothetical protein